MTQIFSTIASGIDPIKANLAVNDLTSRGESLISKGVRVGDLLFHGMDVSKYQKYLSLLGNDSSRFDLLDEFESGRYGIFSLKMGAHEHPYVVDSGLIARERFGKIVSWNFSNKLNWWRGDRCNAINGSDASTFPPYPYLNVKANPQVLDLDLCRSISFQYSKDMVFDDKVQGLTFVLADNTLEDPKIYEPNSCFCKGPDTCLKKGVLDVSTCRGGIYKISEKYHFYHMRIIANCECMYKNINSFADRCTLRHVFCPLLQRKPRLFKRRGWVETKQCSSFDSNGRRTGIPVFLNKQLRI